MFACELPHDWKCAKRAASNTSASASHTISSPLLQCTDDEEQDITKAATSTVSTKPHSNKRRKSANNNTEACNDQLPSRSETFSQKHKVGTKRDKKTCLHEKNDDLALLDSTDKENESNSSGCRKIPSLFAAAMDSELVSAATTTHKEELGDGLSGLVLPGDKERNDHFRSPSSTGILGNPLGNMTKFRSNVCDIFKDDDDDLHTQEMDESTSLFDNADFTEKSTNTIPNEKQQHNKYSSTFHIHSTTRQIIPPTMGNIKKLILRQLQTMLLSHENFTVKDKILSKSPIQLELNAFEDSQRKEPIPMYYLDTENLISRLPYKKMLADMFSNNLRTNLHTVHIPYITRAYEESFMREPMSSSERECAKGKMCECMFLDKSRPFVAVEFLLPGERPGRTPNMCVLCYRSTTQQLYYDVIFDKCDFSGCIQKFGNIHSESGEYALDAMLIAAPTAPVHIMPLPIVSHQRNRYQIYVSSGIKRLKQSKVYFQHTPSYNPEIGQ